MIYKKFYLKEFNSLASKDAYLEIFLYDKPDLPFKNRPAMLVVPGGGYFMIAPLECDAVVHRYMSEGFNCFALSYAINTPYPAPHLDLALAALYIRLHEREFNLDSNLFMIGFSAGAHLVGSFSYLYKELAKTLDVNPDVLTPTAQILAYPVVSFFKNTHPGSRDILTGNNSELNEKFSIELNVDKNYPPTFLFTTLGDTDVNPSNTLDLEKALENAGVLHDKFYFPTLNHGQSVCTWENTRSTRELTEEELECKKWVDKSLNFIIKNFYNA